jgi:isocitrate lyase
MIKEDVLLKRDGKLVRPVRLANGLYKFKEGSNIDRVVLDCITSLQNGQICYGLKQIHQMLSKLLKW